MMRRLALFLLMSSVGGFGNLAAAQAGDSSGSAGSAQGSNAPYEFGFHLGDLLPNQIGGVTEIMALGGASAGFRLSPWNYLEAGFTTGNGSGQQWKNIEANIRMDMPIENLLAIAYVGPDANYFRGVDTSTRVIFGGHAGGGVMAHLGGPTWFRADMKFAFSPGTSLYFGFGLDWRFGGT